VDSFTIRSALGALIAASMTLGACRHVADRPPTSAERGRRSFELYCSDCHGATARGDGPLALAAEPPAPDLTSIAARQRVFDSDRIAAYIDGRMDVARHGTRDMPVWGRKLDDRLEGGLVQETRLSPQTILEIVAYLETLQAQ
jgi:mono/diheme cytochrome c family protein